MPISANGIRILRYIFLLIFVSLPLSMSTVYADANTSEKSDYFQAQEAASKNQWVKAEKHYIQARAIAIAQGDTEHTLDVLFSLLYVYQQQFNGIAAFQTASEIEELAVLLTDPFSLTRSYRLLGIAYQALANNDLARDYFSVAVDSARELNKPVLLASLINELGYADILVSDYVSAIDSFQESFILARSINDQDLMLQAQINLIRSSIALGDKSSIKQKFSLVESLLNEMTESVILTSSIISVGTLYRTAQLKLNLPEEYRKTAYSYYKQGLTLARSTGNIQLQSISNGYIGQLYSDEAQYEVAASYTQEAIVLAQKLNNLDLQYRWGVQLSRIYKAANNSKDALTQYKRVIDILDSLDIVSFMRFERSFNTDVKPVFDELLSILFENVVMESNYLQQQSLLSEAVEYLEKLREKELLAFCFGNCNEKLKTLTGKLPRDTAVIYPIALKNKLFILLKSHSGIYYSKQPLARKKVLEKINRLNENIQNGKRNKAYLKQAKLFHQWLIKPFDKVMLEDKIDTLAIIPSQIFMKFPFDVLYDNNNFLIEQYSLIQVLSHKFQHNETRLDFKLPSYHLKISGDKDINWVSGIQKHIPIYAENDIELLKRRFGKIQHHAILEVSPNLSLTNDYRHSAVVLSDRNLPFFDLLNRINREAPLGVLVNTSHQTGEINNAYFNLQLVNASNVISPLWSYPKAAKNPFFSHFYQSFAAGNSVEMSLRAAKLELIHNKHLNHPVNWAGMVLFQQ